MTLCDLVRSAAAGLAALPAGDPEREEAWRHARACPECARALREAERLHAAIAEVPRAMFLGPAMRARVTGTIDSELRREGWQRGMATVAAVASRRRAASHVGLHCLATELACGGLAVLAGWLALRRGTTSLGARSAAAGAAAGALAGAGALELTCSARDALPHLVTFHVAGVLLAAAAAATVWRSAPNRPSR